MISFLKFYSFVFVCQNPNSKSQLFGRSLNLKTYQILISILEARTKWTDDFAEHILHVLFTTEIQ